MTLPIPHPVRIIEDCRRVTADKNASGQIGTYHGSIY